MIVKANLQAANSNRMFGLTNVMLAKQTEKLSSGYRINRAGDDAAGLAISEKMRRQIRGLTQASNNVQDGVSFCQIADGALDEVADMLNRSKQLSIQAANATLSDSDRASIQAEIEELSAEIDRVHSTSVFNEINVFSDEDASLDSVSFYQFVQNEDGTESLTVNNVTITLEAVDADGNKVNNMATTAAAGTANANSGSAIASFSKKALESAAIKLSQNFPKLFAAASTSGINIGLKLDNFDGVGNTLAVASIQYSSNGSTTTMKYTMQVDTSDYPVGSFDPNSAQAADLAATIAHEMTHLLMYDTNTAGMLGLGGDRYASWFVEGVAQTSSGPGNWLKAYGLNASSDEEAVKAYMSKPISGNSGLREYGQGYIASMYLGQMASGQSAVNPTNIKKGLDNILTSLSKGYTLSAAINYYSGGKYTSVSDFENKVFNNPDDDSVSFGTKLVKAVGNSGAGSIFGSLSTSVTTLFRNGALASGNSNYTLNTGNTQVANTVNTTILQENNNPIPGTFSGGGGGSGSPGGGTARSAGDIGIQAGAEAGQIIPIKRFNVTAQNLMGGSAMDVTDISSAENTITLVEDAAERVSAIRSYYGAMQNRLEHTINNLDNIVENTTAAESLIRDTDMAETMVGFANNQILVQAGQAMLAQANQANQGVLSLLG